jgi:hypothetical protein
MFAIADVIVPPPSLVTMSAMTAVPEPLASALAVGGTSLAGDRGTVNVVVVVVPWEDGPDGDEDSLHPMASTLRPTISTDRRFMTFAPEFA